MQQQARRGQVTLRYRWRAWTRLLALALPVALGLRAAEPPVASAQREDAPDRVIHLPALFRSLDRDELAPRATGVPTATLPGPIPSPSATPTRPSEPSPTPKPAPLNCEAAQAYNLEHFGVSFIAMLKGETICEVYDEAVGSERPLFLASGTKSFSGVIAAAAVEDGFLDWDEPISDTIVEWQDQGRKARITLRQLLNLTSGLDAGDNGAVPTYAEAIAFPSLHPPGQRFQYGPVPFQVFGELMRRKLEAEGLEGDPLSYLQSRILDPIGAKPGFWRRGADGNPQLPSGAAFTAREWIKFGELMRQAGRWEGEPVVAGRELREIVQGSPANASYGLTWWLGVGTRSGAARIPDDLVHAAGSGKNRLYVSREMGLVVVRQTLEREAANASGWNDVAFLNALLTLD